ncbi:uncharacterized protein LOC144441515 [Glandiceps talaboti]
MPASGGLNRPRKPKKQKQQKKVQKRKKELKRLRRDYVKSKAAGDRIAAEQLKKKRTNPKANTELSGKKKRKLLKGLLRNERERSQMDVEFVSPTTKEDSAITGEDVEMQAAE